MESSSEDVLTLSKLKSKVEGTRLLLNRSCTESGSFAATVLPLSGASGDFDETSVGGGHETSLEIEEERVHGEFCDEDIDLGVELDITSKSLVEIAGYVQVQGDDAAISQVQDDAAILPKELMTDILMKNHDKPVANVSPSDLEEASESKFGKTIAKMECTQGARQNAKAENPLPKDQIPTPCGKQRLSYLAAANNRTTKEIRTNNFSCKSSMKLEYTPYKRSDGVPSISLTPEVEAMEKWKKCLVGYFIGVNLPFHVVKREVFKRWSGEGLQRMAYTASGFYLLDFEDEKARDKILDNGPIYVFGRVMVLKKWHLMMSLSKETCDNIPIWVNFHNLPFEFWSGKSLGKIASVLGRPLYVDQATEHLTRVTYARVCIEIDAKEEKVETIRVENEGQFVDVGVKYQWYPLRCEDCKVFGHDISACPIKAKEKEVLASIKNAGAKVINNPRKQENWKEVRRGKNETHIKEKTREPSLALKNSFDIIKGCDDSGVKDDIGNKNRQTREAANDSRLTAKQKRMAQHVASVSEKVKKLFDQAESSELAGSEPASSGLLGSDEIFGRGSHENLGCMEVKARKNTEKSKLKDRKGNVLSLKEVKSLREDSKEVETPIASGCEDSVNGHNLNPDIDTSLFEAFGTKDEGNSDISSPMPKAGLSASDYPCDWSRSRVKKAIRAV